MPPRVRLLAAGMLLAIAAAGCGHGLDLAPVTGRVTLNGQPVTQGEITFLPEDGPQAISTIAADGTFRLTTMDTGDGAIVGKHTVTVMSTKVSGGSEIPTTFEQELEMSRQGVKSGGKILVPGITTWLVPEKYARPQTSELTAEVKAGENIFNFDLKPAE